MEIHTRRPRAGARASSVDQSPPAEALVRFASTRGVFEVGHHGGEHRAKAHVALSWRGSREALFR